MKKWIVLITVIFLVGSLKSQMTTEINDSISKNKKERKVNFTPIPYINYSESQKFMYGAVGMLTFPMSKNDTISPKSIAGASYIRTTRGSWFGNVFTQIFLNEDKWRILGMVGTGTFSFQTFVELGPVSGFYDYNSDNIVFSARVFRRFHKRNFFGLGYFYNKVDTKFTDVPVESGIESSALSFIYLNDARNSVYFPTKGQKIFFMYSQYPEWLGNDKNFGVLNGYVNKYFGNEKNVVAVRAFAKAGTNKLDFQRQVVLSRVDLRGYTSGKYRGDGKMDLQAEYRHQFQNRIGLVGFAGLGTLYGSNIDDFNWKLYPSIGAGFRFLAVKETGMRFGVDVARGKDDWAFYFRIGEAF